MLNTASICVTSNQLTLCYGHTPLEKNKDHPDIKRGFIVYIGGEYRYPGFNKIINPRMFYYDFDKNIKNQIEFEKKLIDTIRSGKGLMNDEKINKNSSANGPFPNIFQSNLNQIDFGWKPCFVSYILDVTDMEFIAPNIDEGPNYLNQPIIFRRDKVIVSDSGIASIENYDGNNSFFDLVHRTHEGTSILAMKNLMLDRHGKPIKKPKGMSSNKLPYWDHCMDIQVRMEQGKKSKRKVADTTAVSQPFIAVPGSSKWLTIVFDPPQTNGGGGGPPG
jgi:hypothetical protein